MYIFVRLHQFQYTFKHEQNIELLFVANLSKYSSRIWYSVFLSIVTIRYVRFNNLIRNNWVHLDVLGSTDVTTPLGGNVRTCCSIHISEWLRHRRKTMYQ